MIIKISFVESKESWYIVFKSQSYKEVIVNKKDSDERKKLPNKRKKDNKKKIKRKRV